MVEITRRGALGAIASLSAIGAVQAAPAAAQPLTRPEQIKHHFYALKALLEDEFQVPWLMVLATEGCNPSRILGINAGKLNDPHGIIGPATRDEVVS